MHKLLRLYSHKWQILTLVLLFGISRLTALSRLPVFNDEAIYIDWAWRSINLSGFAFFSLLDGKQPVVLWIMGVLETVLPNMLWAGRFSSVLWSSIAIGGVYISARLLFQKKQIAILAACIYCITPLLVFYDRQALYESAVSAIFSWLFASALWYIKRPTLPRALALGAILGGGLWIKSSVVVAVPALLLVIVVGLGKKAWHSSTIGQVSYALFISLLIGVLIYIQPTFQQAATVNRYIFSFSELLALPIAVWLNNTFTAIEIMWWLGTPLLLIGTVGYGIHPIFRSRYGVLPLVYSGVVLAIIVLASRALNPRYVVAPMSILSLPAAAFFYQVWSKKLITRVGVIAVFALTSCISVFLLLSPERYLRTLDRALVYPLTAEYLDSWTAGTAGQQAVAYVQGQLGNQPGYVFVRRDAGNPESLVLYSFHKNQRILATYFDALEIPSLESTSCIQSSFPVFFISRDKHLGGTERFWQEQKRFENGTSTVGVYIPKSECNKEALEL